MENINVYGDFNFNNKVSNRAIIYHLRNMLKLYLDTKKESGPESVWTESALTELSGAIELVSMIYNIPIFWNEDGTLDIVAFNKNNQ